ncbi:SPOR domain-containing protein [Sphingomonas jatrophae]|uniref:Sel1 repeat-containing protein n=1 Tax=Sphingomonas jatrophae TaxID=1166337 RepID=A0A1I6JRT9_9SPHN|nr:SPOR domain-containing protein [Sphingomonas jatrophae]SFR81684.1 Sel1 repeat-containing protein [Sphingomonas jatrophae]
MTFAPTLILIAAAAAAVPPVKQGVDAWQAGDYQKAVKAWTDPAAAGDADAQFNLAQAYKLGRGVPLDLRQAEAWYRKAADQGHRQAGAMLGLIMFQNGDRKGALPWIQKAADAGDPRAQYVYGTALFNGDETVRDYPRAYALMTKAAAAGLPQAQASLKQMDQFIPLPDRQKGLAAAKLIGSAPTATAATAPAPRPAPVRATALPPSRVAEAGAAPSVPNVTKTVPTSKPAAMAASRPAAVQQTKAIGTPASGGKWRIQLGAFSDAAAARGAWSTVSGKAGLSRLSPSYVKAGAVTRLQAGPFSTRAAATQACKASGVTGCFPVGG